MEDILASIRRILSEDEHANARQAETAPPDAPAAVARHPPEVFNLDASMIVEDQPPQPAPVAPERPQPAAAPPPAKSEPLRGNPPEPEVFAPAPAPAQQLTVALQPAPSITPDMFVAPAAAAAAAMSIGSLRRTLETERPPSQRGGGITVEDMVREELRPMLKNWLDAHLALIVERLVRAEIERVVGRSDS